MTVKCSASDLPSNGPNTELIWIFNGQNIGSASNNGETLARSHTIQSFGISDIGTYTCRASNPDLSGPITDTVTIQGKLL